MSTLPTSRTFVAELISSVPASNPLSSLSSTNPLKDLTVKARNTLLTLHVLFPNEFLPALDLLDRGLVVKFVVRGEGEEEEDKKREATVVEVGALDEGVRRGDGNVRSDDQNQNAPQTSTRLETVDVETSVEAKDDGDCEDDMLFDLPQEIIEEAADQLQSNISPPTTVRSPSPEPNLNPDPVPVPGPAQAPTLPTNPTSQHPSLYYVRSAQAQSQSRHRSYDRSADYTPTSYEVRPLAWNCSCPAFAFSAFPASNSSAVNPPSSPESKTPGTRTENQDQDFSAHFWSTHVCQQESDPEREATEQDPSWSFGGLNVPSQTVPICKHILACVLVEHCQLFSRLASTKRVSRAEMAGWAAGWGG
ncbi:hypothetical protein K402DRAFT_389536 [Aulographum hederae CBS 113979]|uniref:SWIM-type domain-containing protein n=1 Tax=Aulographum hederae CBS 113979 TaxID=1176131 RepID=A0A6G1HC58_9PEZI|nr:hypothetical protein K402DRAFT_389536 [Aulographum hederae CBS 113979]